MYRLLRVGFTVSPNLEPNCALILLVGLLHLVIPWPYPRPGFTSPRRRCILPILVIPWPYCPGGFHGECTGEVSFCLLDSLARDSNHCPKR